ncbi:MAG: SMP-30/gluconolactonase/LRE family protein [Opitutus sp.]|nr:SMP-30/gluconolactonase/LRE family protein [Opitutus sp.]
MSHSAEIALRIEATLGEGALWDVATQRLLWVDITQKRVCRFDPVSGANEVFQLDAMVGTVVATTRGDMLVALQQGVARLDPKTGRVSDLRCPAGHDAKRIRFNDGKCDPRGRLWVGSMALDFAQGAGALYCFDPDGTVSERVRQVTVSNGIVWSHDQRKMYYIDSPTRAVDVFDYDVETGAIANRRHAWELPEGWGFPDGMTIDAEGKLWIALWGGSAVVRWDPESGRVLEKIAVPAPHVTSCAFGGPDLKSLYITSAREGRSAEQLAQEPLAGSIFVARPGVCGVEAFVYCG